MINQQGRHTAQLHRTRTHLTGQTARRKLWGTVLATLFASGALLLSAHLPWPLPSPLSPRGQELLLLTQNLSWGALALLLSLPLSLWLRSGLPWLRIAFLALYLGLGFLVWPSGTAFLKDLVGQPHLFPGPLSFVLAGLALLAAALMARKHAS